MPSLRYHVNDNALRSFRINAIISLLSYLIINFIDNEGLSDDLSVCISYWNQLLMIIYFLLAVTQNEAKFKGFMGFLIGFTFSVTISYPNFLFTPSRGLSFINHFTTYGLHLFSFICMLIEYKYNKTQYQTREALFYLTMLLFPFILSYFFYTQFYHLRGTLSLNMKFRNDINTAVFLLLKTVTVTFILSYVQKLKFKVIETLPQPHAEQAMSDRAEEPSDLTLESELNRCYL